LLPVPRLLPLGLPWLFPQVQAVPTQILVEASLLAAGVVKEKAALLLFRRVLLLR
jgi:hypothetical protein